MKSDLPIRSGDQAVALSAEQTIAAIGEVTDVSDKSVSIASKGDSKDYSRNDFRMLKIVAVHAA